MIDYQKAIKKLMDLLIFCISEEEFSKADKIIDLLIKIEDNKHLTTVSPHEDL
jgi:hypothetical protein